MTPISQTQSMGKSWLRILLKPSFPSFKWRSHGLATDSEDLRRRLLEQRSLIPHTEVKAARVAHHVRVIEANRNIDSRSLVQDMTSLCLEMRYWSTMMDRSVTAANWEISSPKWLKGQTSSREDWVKRQRVLGLEAQQGRRISRLAISKTGRRRAAMSTRSWQTESNQKPCEGVKSSSWLICKDYSQNSAALETSLLKTSPSPLFRKQPETSSLTSQRVWSLLSETLDTEATSTSHRSDQRVSPSSNKTNSTL